MQYSYLRLFESTDPPLSKPTSMPSPPPVFGLFSFVPELALLLPPPEMGGFPCFPSKSLIVSLTRLLRDAAFVRAGLIFADLTGLVGLTPSLASSLLGKLIGLGILLLPLPFLELVAPELL